MVYINRSPVTAPTPNTNTEQEGERRPRTQAVDPFAGAGLPPVRTAVRGRRGLPKQTLPSSASLGGFDLALAMGRSKYESLRGARPPVPTRCEERARLRQTMAELRYLTARRGPSGLRLPTTPPAPKANNRPAMTIRGFDIE